MENKILSFLGLGKKAGYLTTGETGCEISIKKKKAKLIVVAKDASENTKKKFENMAKSKEVEFILFSTKEELGKILGKDIVATITINDENFAKALKKKIELE